MTVLICHRFPVVRDAIAGEVRSRLGIADVVVAGSTVECVERVRAQQLRAAVLDVDLMPGADLFLCATMRDHGVPVVVVTHEAAVEPFALLEAGAQGIVLSSGGLDEVLIGVRTVLEGHAYVPTHLLGSVLKGLIAQRRTQQVTSNPVDRLSPRERQVLGLLGAGADHREIAARLVISPHTAKTHIQRLLGKLEVRSRVEAAALAVSHGLVAPELEVAHD